MLIRCLLLFYLEMLDLSKALCVLPKSEVCSVFEDFITSLLEQVLNPVLQDPNIVVNIGSPLLLELDVDFSIGWDVDISESVTKSSEMKKSNVLSRETCHLTFFSHVIVW